MKHFVTVAGNIGVGKSTLVTKLAHNLNWEPYYEPVANEIQIFESAYRNRLAVSLRGPTGCGKTRFMEHMAWRLKLPLITVSCHDDLTASDLIGRYLITDNQTVWVDGPLTAAVRSGAISVIPSIPITRSARKSTTIRIEATRLIRQRALGIKKPRGKAAARRAGVAGDIFRRRSIVATRRVSQAYAKRLNWRFVGIKTVCRG